MKIKFKSIFHRYIFFIFILSIMTFNMVSGGKAWKINLPGATLTIEQKELLYIIIVFAVLAEIISFRNWKFYISKEGIYLRKLDLLVPWEDITAVSHIRINEWDMAAAGKSFFYNRKTLVIYREKYKPVCIYNISLFALYAVKLYHSEIRTNILSAAPAEFLNLILAGWLLYTVGFDRVRNIRFGTFIVWSCLCAVNSTFLPLLMLRHQNKLHGAYLSSDTAYKKNPSNAIHV